MALTEFPFDNLNKIGMTWPIVRTPMQKAIVQTSASGKEYRTSLYPFPRWKWKMDFGYLWDDYYSARTMAAQFMFQTLAGFYNQVNGQYLSWLYQDPWDNTYTVAQPAYWQFNGIWQPTANGTQTAFQLFKLQTGGPIEPVQYVSTGSIFVNGVLQSGGAYTITQPPCVVTFNSAPANGAAITWTGTFDYLCRFTADSFDFSHDHYGKYSAKQIEFMSVFA